MLPSSFTTVRSVEVIALGNISPNETLAFQDRDILLIVAAQDQVQPWRKVANLISK
jgi:hypothetical protein